MRSDTAENESNFAKNYQKSEVFERGDRAAERGDWVPPGRWAAGVRRGAAAGTGPPPRFLYGTAFAQDFIARHQNPADCASAKYYQLHVGSNPIPLLNLNLRSKIPTSHFLSFSLHIF